MTNSTTAKAMPTGYAISVEISKPSSERSKYVKLTADINDAGSAVISEPKRYLPFLSRYAVDTQSAIIASVWLLHEKYRQTIWNPSSLTIANHVSPPPITNSGIVMSSRLRIIFWSSLSVSAKTSLALQGA